MVKLHLSIRICEQRPRGDKDERHSMDTGCCKKPEDGTQQQCISAILDQRHRKNKMNRPEMENGLMATRPHHRYSGAPSQKERMS
jgi:hypothetical protein